MVSELVKVLIMLCLCVLILVIMEFGFWAFKKPSFGDLPVGLNPCYNGIWFLRAAKSRGANFYPVLILVIMEFGFWGLSHLLIVQRLHVLILVIMEFGFWVQHLWQLQVLHKCLNPCYNGIWFLRRPRFDYGTKLSES